MAAVILILAVKIKDNVNYYYYIIYYVIKVLIYVKVKRKLTQLPDNLPLRVLCVPQTPLYSIPMSENVAFSMDGVAEICGRRLISEELPVKQTFRLEKDNYFCLYAWSSCHQSERNALFRPHV